ncbi:MAG: RNA polymerase sigma factor [Opitutaceae bacterium]|jgi:RNA polymerase sigma-70 factor (ECF subfamily)
MLNGLPVQKKNTPEAVAVPSLSKQEAAYDAELARRFNDGDDAAFVEIMQRYRGKIYGLTLSMLRNASDAEEITQDTFIRAHRGLARFRGDSSLSTWLYRIALNLARNRYWYFFRRRRHDSVSLERKLGDDSDSTFGDLIAADAHDPLQETATTEFSDLIAGCMEQLDAKHREILNMRNMLNLSYEEIAHTLSINVGTVKSRIARARENLRGLLSKTCPEFAPDASPADYFIPARAAYGRPTIAYA